MQTKPTLGKLKETIFIGRALKGSILALAIFALGFILVPALIAEASASQYADASVTWGAVSLTLDPDYGNGNIDDEGHGDIDFGELVPTANNLAEAGSSYGTLKVLKKTIGITSSGKFYTVYISTLTNDNNLSLELSGGGNNSSITIPATTSTFASPNGFVDSGWGFAVPGVQATGVPNAPSTFVIPSLLNTQIGAQTAVEGAAQTYTTTKWAAVPGSNSPQQIWKAEAQGAAGANCGFGTYLNAQSVECQGDMVNNHFDIYYAVAVDTDVLAGTYSNHIVYTALANASSLDSVSNNINHDRSFGGTGDTQTIRFDLTQSTVTLSESDITVTLVPHSVMVANNYESAAFDIASIGSADTPGYLNCPVVPDSITVDGYVEVECIMPSSVPADNSGNGAYDFWVHVNGYNYNYVSKDTITKGSTTPTIPAFLYAGLQTDYPTSDARYNSTSGADNHIVKEMQQMSAGVCSNTNIWNNQTGDNARIYDYTGLKKLVADVQDTDSTADDYYDSANYASAAAQNQAQNAALNVGSFKLIDNRDQKPYLVRRLADGNCWMVQNLDLRLSDFAGNIQLTNQNTDLNTKSTWDPSATTLTKARQYDGTAAQNNYFRIYSNRYLGNDQKYQFQVGILGTSGANEQYYWGTTVAESANETLSEVTQNINSAIPRSYSFQNDWRKRDGSIDTEWNADNASLYNGSYYNFFAATAESPSKGIAGSVVEDSICSTNWQLPDDGDTGNRRSVENLSKIVLYDQYSTGLERSMASIEIPLSINFYGRYQWRNGNLINYNNETFLWYRWNMTTTYAYASGGGFYKNDTGYYSTINSTEKVYGATIRCASRPDKNETAPDTACPSGKICFKANGGTGTSMDNVSANDGSTNLRASTYIKENAAFVGWSTSPDGYDDVYGPNESIGTSSSSAYPLYAKWLASSGTMQDFSNTQCAAMSEFDIVALTDIRNGRTYSITKFADGNCWMTSDLQINLADFAGTDGLNSSNTNLTSTATNAALTECSLSDACYSENETNYYWNPENGSDEDSVPRQYTDSETGYIYTNWYAVTAGSGKNSMSGSTQASDSVCPSGWRLPGYNTGTPYSWRSLFTDAYSFVANASSPVSNSGVRKFPFSIERHGLYESDTDSLWNPVTTSSYWTTAAVDTPDGGSLYLGNGGDFYTQYHTNKKQGLSVRCVKDKTQN